MEVGTDEFRYKIFGFITNFQRKFAITHCNDCCFDKSEQNN